MFRAIAALALASASAQTPTLTSNAPWWERVTVTVTDDGQTQSCRYESSLTPSANKDCTVTGAASPADMTHRAGAKDQYTRLTFERRFSPDASPNLDSLQPGETLLGGQVMALAIDGNGSVKGCRIVATSGSVKPQYGCDEATAERFQASAGTPRARTAEHAGYLSIIVYGHSEHVV